MAENREVLPRLSVREPIPSRVVPYEALFPGEVRYVWEDSIDVQAGENVFRVPRKKLGTWNTDVWRFNAIDAEWFYEAADYDPESEIDYDGDDA
jgi:hypothetical protein